MSRYVVVDHDGGVDDAVALLLTLKAVHERDDRTLCAVTTVRGNVSALQAARNTQTAMRVFHAGHAGSSEMLSCTGVYVGCESSILGERIHLWDGHGALGLGPATSESEVLLPCAATDEPRVKREPELEPEPEPEPELELELAEEHAVTALVRIIMDHEVNSVDILGLGPLTNLAMAIRMEPEVGKRLGGLFWMGGSLAARGNSTCSSEFNAHADPEALHVVMTALGPERFCIVTWDVTELAGLTSTEYNHMIESATAPAAHFVRSIYATYERLVSTQDERHEQALQDSRPDDCGENEHGVEHPVMSRFSNPATPSSHLLAGLAPSAKRQDQPFVICDALVPALYFDPTIVTGWRVFKATVELGNKETRGTLHLRHYPWQVEDHAEQIESVSVVEIVDRDKFVQFATAGLQ